MEFIVSIRKQIKPEDNSTKGGLLFDAASAIEEDKNGNIWFSSLRGISILNPTIGAVRSLTRNKALPNDVHLESIRRIGSCKKWSKLEVTTLTYSMIATRYEDEINVSFLLSESLWLAVEPLLPGMKQQTGGRGRPAKSNRQLWESGLMQLHAEGKLDWEYQSIDGCQTKAPPGGEATGLPCLFCHPLPKRNIRSIFVLIKATTAGRCVP